ncbi:LysR family transcriptional regulator [Phaeobacter sp. HF9A]|uniref:LysR family transcriptional regulator n=1 Tax=Phaeobacter sp. HF9A TaxID=2721561 RepID=UPI001430C959|nr:LysR family transcriptional regulator [Phaeobacter sp. HF9A]NIZ12422.1 LysR family transcriptional regulator [Phaeobacter sp. HF9A]
MDRLTLLETFTVALDEGSLNRAAQRRSLTQSAISQQIKQLEQLIGQQLLHRTAQGVRATRAGELVYDHAQGLLGGYDRMLAELSVLDTSLSGVFRISVNTFLARKVVGPLLLELDQQHEDLNIVMRVDDRLVNVVRENFDLAIRSGRLGDTDGVGRRIGEIETVLFATSGYLDNIGRPQRPEDLKRLKFIQYHEDQTKGFFPMLRDGVESLAPIRVGFTADDPELIMRAVSNGAGYTRAPLFFVQELLRSGTYERVLPDWTAPNKDIFAVYPSRHSRDRRRELIIDGIAERLQEALHPQDRPPRAQSPLDLSATIT